LAHEQLRCGRRQGARGVARRDGRDVRLRARALKITIAPVGDELDTIPAFALCVGPAIYLLSFVGLRYRVSRTLGRGCTITALACIAVFPLPPAIPALAALAVITTIWVAFHAYELIWWRDERTRTRTLR